MPAPASHPPSPIRTPEELEAELGGNLRTLRLQRNLSQETLAERAGLSLGAIRHLEAGAGSSTSTLAKVLNALGKGDALANLARVSIVDPYAITREARQRQRAPRKKSQGSPLLRPAQPAQSQPAKPQPAKPRAAKLRSAK
jgi:transcriptional regulator with XRE-family HTH domain